MQRMNSLITELENDPKLETEIDKVFSIQGAPIKERIVNIYSVDSGYGFLQMI